jgi:hypothetical protein
MIQTRSQTRRKLMEIQTRSKTRSERASDVISEFQMYVEGITKYQGLQRIKAMYEFIVYADKNFSSIRDAIEISYPTIWAGVKDAMNRCKKDNDEGKTSLLTLLSKNESKEIIRLVYKLASKF